MAQRSRVWVFLFVYFWPFWVFDAVHRLSSCGRRGLLFFAAHGLLVAVASLVAEHGLWSTGSVAVAHGLSCSAAWRIFLDQGSNPWPLHWQVGSHQLHHQGSPRRLLKRGTTKLCFGTPVCFLE